MVHVLVGILVGILVSIVMNILVGMLVSTEHNYNPPPPAKFVSYSIWSLENRFVKFNGLDAANVW